MVEGCGKRNHIRPMKNCATTARDPLINNALLTPSELTEMPVSKLPSEMPLLMASMYRLIV